MEFKFKKKYGQNFLKDENIINKIINKADIKSDTLVIEIGPGAAALTTKIEKKTPMIICYEIDESLKPILEKKLKPTTKVIYRDFLKTNPKEDIKKYEYNQLYIISNLPYYITTPIINKIISEKINPDKIVIMVQKEVGERFKARPGTKEYNSLSIYLNYYYKISKITDVSRNVFIPKPNVDSIVLMLEPNPSKPYIKDEGLFFKLIKDAFKQKRKTLKNNLKSYDLTTIEKVLTKHSLTTSVRAEALSIELFAEIANALAKE